ncbi:MAG TPA: MarR family transcriptional regulator [Streptosporangiaceae bacterium]
MSWCSGGDKLDQEIFDAMTEFISYLMQRGEQLSQSYGVPVSAIKALRRLNEPVPMKDLGQRMRCDPSFVTMIADVLEKHGLATREPNPADRRVKNLALTDRGLEVKAAMEQDTLGLMPWTHALDRSERQQFLTLLRKMCDSLAAAPPADREPAKEVTTAAGAISPVA